MNRLTRRFDELIQEIDRILRTAQTRPDPLSGRLAEYVDSHAYLAWQVNAANAIDKAAGVDSPQARRFEEAGKSGWDSNKQQAEKQKAVLTAVRADHDGGYLTSARSLARAEVFDTELELAKELLNQGYDLPAAIVARTVLETALRGLCDQHGVSYGKLDLMNSALAKVQAYSGLVQKKITALADVGNSAAHGKREKFKASDVEEMIEGVSKFVMDFPVA